LFICCSFPVLPVVGQNMIDPANVQVCCSVADAAPCHAVNHDVRVTPDPTLFSSPAVATDKLGVVDNAGSVVAVPTGAVAVLAMPNSTRGLTGDRRKVSGGGRHLGKDIPCASAVGGRGRRMRREEPER
jgi:hypothetical protein